MSHPSYNFYARVFRAAYVAHDTTSFDCVKASHVIAFKVGKEFETSLSEPGDSEDNLRLACLLAWDYPQKSPKDIAEFLTEVVRISSRLRREYQYNQTVLTFVDETEIRNLCDKFLIRCDLTDEPGDAGPVILRLPCCISNRYDGTGWTVQPNFEPI